VVLPGFTGVGLPGSSWGSALAGVIAPANGQGVGLADLWTKETEGSHQVPSGGWVNCKTESFCSVILRWCRSRCDNGEDSGWHVCGGCFGIGGWSWDW
jgi:hypothetical protein